MTSADFMALLPLLIVGYVGVLLMVLAAFRIGHRGVFGITLAGLVFAFASVFVAFQYAPRTVTSFIRVDAFSLYFTGLVIAAALIIVLFSRDYLEAHERQIPVFYLLLLFAVLGMGVVASSIHLISFFLGVEVLSLSLYGLIGYTREHRESLEGAVRYLIMAAVSSAFLLFGIALIYSETGTMDVSRLTMLLVGGDLSVVFLFGMALVLVVFGFKLALVPFHTWSPDVYQGAPAPVTALIASGSKGAVLAFLLRLTMTGGLTHSRTLFLAITLLSIATMSVGNLLALLQRNVKRLLAYSSIAHMGYLLIPLLSRGLIGASSIAFYLAAYFAATLAAFGTITALSAARSDGDVEEMKDYQGLASRRPILAAIFSLALISLTGVPPTIGFIAKFYIFSAAIRSGLWMLVLIGVINSGISAFYYLRLVVVMYSPPTGEPVFFPTPKPLASIALGISVFAMLIFGVYPTPLIGLAEQVMRMTGLR